MGLGHVLEFWRDQVPIKQCRRKLSRGRRVAGVIRSLVNVRTSLPALGRRE